MGRFESFGPSGMTPRGPLPGRRAYPTKRFLWLPVAVAVAVLLAYAFLFGDTGYLRERSLRREMASLDDEITALRREAQQVKGLVAGLEEGGVEIERIGRERLGLIKPGEISYRLVPMDHEGWALDKGGRRE